MQHAFIGKNLKELPTPSLVLDATIFERNLAKMEAICKEKGIALRPHVKSHKCPTIAHMQMRYGAIGVCAATIGEAEVMAYGGLDHIFLANEVIDEHSINRLVNLAQGRNILVAVDNESNLKTIANKACAKGVTIGIIVDLDVGMARCGVKNYKDLHSLAVFASQLSGVEFKGVMGYEGHMALTPEKELREQGGRKATQLLLEMVSKLRQSGLEVPIVTGGGTGTYQHYFDMKGVTEIEAGSYIFMDKTYSGNLGNIDFEQSLFVLGTVISQTGNEMVLNVGLKAISPERSTPQVVSTEPMEVNFVQEEHLKATFTSFCPHAVGDTIFVIPTHCCTTVNLYDTIFVFRDGIIEAAWPILARRA